MGRNKNEGEGNEGEEREGETSAEGVGNPTHYNMLDVICRRTPNRLRDSWREATIRTNPCHPMFQKG